MVAEMGMLMREFNLENFTYKASSAINRAFAIAGELGHTYIGSEHILLEFLMREHQRLILF